MAGRKGINPNADAPPQENTRRTEWASEAELGAQEALRNDARAAADALDETVSRREADSRREVPRLRTDSIDPKMDRALPAPSAIRGMASSRVKKSLNSQKVKWQNELPATRAQAVNRTMMNPERLEGVNRALSRVTGIKSDLTPAVRRRVERLDRSIQDYEAQNKRQHIVYSVLKAPVEHGNSRRALRNRLEGMSDDPNSRLTFDGYIPATHSLGNIADGQDIVMEIRTYSGAYLGKSDSKNTPNANHVMGRGRVLKPVGVHTVNYTKPDGSQGTRTIVQMEDVTEN